MKTFLLCCILFLGTAFSSPHNGSTLAAQSDKTLQNATLYSDNPMLVPLQQAWLLEATLPQATLVESLRFHKEVFFVEKKEPPYRLYHRNFYAHILQKPKIGMSVFPYTLHSFCWQI